MHSRSRSAALRHSRERKSAMHHSKYLSIALALAIVPSAPLFAQEADEGVLAETTQGESLRLPTYIKAPIGAEATVANRAGETLGVMRDHVVEHRTGVLQFVAVGTARGEDAAHLVPYDRFEWNKKEGRLVLEMTADELAALPKYDPKSLKKAGAKDAQAGDGDGARVERKRKTTVAASELVGTTVMAREDAFAAVSELIIEPKTGTIAFVLASPGTGKDDPFVVPYEALTYQPASKEAQLEKPQFLLDVARESLREAPVLKGGDVKGLTERKALEGIFGFYELELPTAGPVEAGTRG